MTRQLVPHIFIPVILLWLLFPALSHANVWEWIEKGEAALARESLLKAEDAFKKGVRENPEGYRALKGLAEVQIRLKKFQEADQTLQQLLDLQVTGGRKAQIILDGNENPIEVEIIDETVLKQGPSIVPQSQFLKTEVSNVKSYFRVFRTDSGKVDLILKEKAQIKFIGIPRVVRERMVELKDKIKKKLIQAAAPSSKFPENREMVQQKGGCFLMGSDHGDADERPIHEVCVSSFKMDPWEITQREFQKVMNSNPSHFPGPDLPVDSVTWMEAQEYCKKLGKRLPTEAEWEYAARGGAKTEYYWGDEIQEGRGNFCDRECSLNARLENVSDGFQTTAPVGSFPPNPYGLYDMAGNVSEWVADSYYEGYYITSPKDNPKGYLPEQKEKILVGVEEGFLAERSASRKVVRGGAWENDFLSLRSASRKVFYPGYRIEGVGFRCAGD